MARAVPLARALGEAVGQVVADIHGDHGVQLIVGDTAAAFEGTSRVEQVITAGGRRLPCDFVVVGMGAEPVTDLVAGSPVTLDHGIVVDEYSRTSVEGIYAAGDVTNHYHPVFTRRIHVEHWQNALLQGPAAARSMLGKGEPYAAVPWFWSDQYEDNLQYAGMPAEWDQLVVRGRLTERRFVAFYLRDGRLLATIGINRGKEVHQAMRVIAAGRPVEARRLQDEDVSLRTL